MVSKGTLLVAENKTGYHGVYPYHRSKDRPFVAQVTQDGRVLTLGCFSTAEEAAMCVARTPEGRAAAKRAASAPPARPDPAAIEMVAQEAAEATEAEAAETAAAAGAEAEAAEAAAAVEKAAAEKAAAEKAADGQVSGRTRMRKTLAYALVAVSAPRAARTLAQLILTLTPPLTLTLTR